VKYVINQDGTVVEAAKLCGKYASDCSSWWVEFWGWKFRGRSGRLIQLSAADNGMWKSQKVESAILSLLFYIYNKR